MLISLDKAVPGADAAAQPSDVTPLQIKVNPADAILGTAGLEDAEKTPARKEYTRFGRFLRYSAGTAIIACLCGFAWVAGAYYSAGHPLDFMKTGAAAGVGQSLAHEDPENAIRQLADEIRALKASVDEARDADGKSGESHDRTDTAQTKTGAALSDLTGRVDKLETALTTQLSHVNEQLASIEQKISEPHAISASRARSPARHAEHHDAFDPSRDPTAPGAPRPLGAY